MKSTTRKGKALVRQSTSPGGTTLCRRCEPRCCGWASTASAGGIILEYTNRSTGGPVMPTIDCHMQLLRPREKTQVRRSVCGTNYHVVEGAGCSIVGDQRLDWEEKDVFTVPTWTFCEHVNTGDRPAFLFSFSDAPVMKALRLYRDETRS